MDCNYEQIKKNAFITAFLYNKSRLDNSDMYRHYYARVRKNIWTNPNYVKFVKDDFDSDNYTDIINYLYYNNWIEESNYPETVRYGNIEDYAKYAHKIAMQKILVYRSHMVNRINNNIITIRNYVYNN